MATNLRFEWDPPKAARNKAKHKLSFELAKEVFFDPFVLTELDGYEHGEERWRTIGAIGSALVLVIHTTRENEAGEEVIRIISARRAEPKERRHYEEGAKAQR